MLDGPVVLDPDTGELRFGGPIQVRDLYVTFWLLFASWSHTLIVTSIQVRAGEVGGQSVEDSEQWYAQVLHIGARKPPQASRDGQEQDIHEKDVSRIISSSRLTDVMCIKVCLRVAWFYDHGSECV
jgi:hypothetical protein